MGLVTNLPEVFEEFGEARRDAFLSVKKVKDQGIPVVGVFCTFMPEEIALAAGAIQVSLCAASDETIGAAEEDLPRNLCPLIKSSYGFAKTDKCPFFYFSDIVIGETTCDGKKKMFEYMGDFKPVHLMNFPNAVNSDPAIMLWKSEIVRLKERLEDFFGVTITDDDIRKSIHLVNEERKAKKNFYSLGKLDPPAISGFDIYKVVSGASFKFNKQETINTLNEMTTTIMENYKAGETLKSKPRILVTGTPIGGSTEKVLHAIEDNGGIIVAFENCSVAKAVEDLVDEDIEDVYDALTDKYLNIGCACISYNVKRKELLSRMCDEYKVDGVIDLVLQYCHPFATESKQIKMFVNDNKEIPYLYLETDFSQSDVEQIKTRVSAFIEMIGDSL